MVEQKKRTRITQSGKNCAINCAIMGARLIWKQTIWLVLIRPYCWLANHNPCVICTVLHFLHWCYTFCTPFSANQNRVIFSCILLGQLTCISLLYYFMIRGGGSSVARLFWCAWDLAYLAFCYLLDKPKGSTDHSSSCCFHSLFFLHYFFFFLLIHYLLSLILLLHRTSYNSSFIRHSFHGKTWTQPIDLLSTVWLCSSVG